jgi:hypothetical protein
MQDTEHAWRLPEHPFWDGWFRGQSFGYLAVAFVLLSLADLLATVALLPQGIREGNLLADTWLKGYGLAGFYVYKAALVIVVLLATGLLTRYRPRLAHGILWAGLLLTGLVVLRHLAIVAGFMSYAR